MEDRPSEADMVADVENNWLGRINELLYVVQFRPALDQGVVDSVTQRVQEGSGLTRGADIYVRSIDKALESDQALAEGTDPNHSETEIRDFLGNLREALVAAQPGD